MAPWPSVDSTSYRSGATVRAPAAAWVSAVVGVMAGGRARIASTDFVEERQAQAADLDDVAALEGRLRHDLPVHPHPGPAGEIAHLVAGAVAQHQDVMLGPRRHPEVAQRGLADQHGAALETLEVEGVLLAARFPLEVGAPAHGDDLLEALHVLLIHLDRVAGPGQVGAGLDRPLLHRLPQGPVEEERELPERDLVAARER